MMKKKILLGAIAIGAILAFGSCKPKQSAYKSVYEAAKEREIATQPVYEEEYVAPQPVPKKTATTESTRKEKVTGVTAQDESSLKKYSVVVAAIGMKPNAELLKSKLEDAGYTVILVQNEAGMYRVIIATSTTKDQAYDDRDNINTRFLNSDSQERLKAKYGIPFNDWWILERTY